ncbi:hypothetical protein PHSY_007163 [Pseudozyma hubeiensis SY62]|uniref:Ima1 N-terminal domain-containing protein n=1 Tax=Pseudozyma hubeiensis (strain SY62) TaxID=1305764 RepID=R9PDX9_PSEHS|nr:hypothetical protein PHSY_007163 [Pseudozyma hubeiensis SY62]GAC99561.1 hypothetical protein PHSY_007163 [Pseudozyma hubeiensis SY62]
MWNLLPWTGRGASGYPRRECFFCCTTSIILPPYKPQSVSELDTDSIEVVQAPSHDIATSSTTSTISTGTPTNWFCSSCHCQNVAKLDGTPVEQYTRPMWDEAWNRDRSRLMRHMRPRASTSVQSSSDRFRETGGLGPHSKNSFTFCHTCQTNQVLTLNMLADYLPSEDDPGYEKKLRNLPEYEASLASRYPPVCSDCAPRVQERITERDQFARSWSLGRWLDLKKEASNADLADSIAGPLSASDDKQATRRYAPMTSDLAQPSSRFSFRGIVGNLDNGSPLTMAVAAFATVGLWSVYLWTALWPHNTAALVHQVMEQTKRAPFSLCTATTGLTCLVIVPWLLTIASKVDPIKHRIERARIRQLRVEAKGLTLWHTIQSMLLCLRLSLLLVATSGLLSPRSFTAASEWTELSTGRTRIELLGLAAAALLLGEVGLTVMAASQLGIRVPAALQLVSRPIVANARSSKPSNQHSDALLTSLSLDDRAALLSAASDMDPENDDDLVAEPGMRVPRMDRDADGDAVMEDAATYAARRSSWGDESDQDDARLSTQTSAWAGQWSKTAASQQASFAASFKQDATRTGSSRYTDFQLGPQRFWEPQIPTGLEDVFGRAVSLDDRAEQQADGNRTAGSSGKWSQWFGFS